MKVNDIIEQITLAPKEMKKNNTSRYTYIDKCGRLLYSYDGLIMQVIGVGKEGWNLKVKK